METKTARYQRETQDCYRNMLKAVHALGVYRVEGTVPGTEEHIVLNGNPGIYPGRPSATWAHKTVTEDAEAIIRRVQHMFLGGRQAAPVTLVWKPDSPAITL